MKIKLVFVLVFVVAVSLLVLLFRQNANRVLFAPRQTNVFQTIKTEMTLSAAKDTEVVAQDLKIPWEIAFLPNGDMLVTERPGRLLKIKSGTKVISEIEGVKHIGEGGLLGMALHPNFSSNNFIYLYSTTQNSNGVSNRVERYKLINDSLSDRTVILEGIKGSVYHDGGRIAFGPDGYLYITAGDAENQNLAQDKNSLNGKILRIKDDGSIPADNPFGNAVYSMGHRNPQGLAWDKNGTLWETEHGPSGAQTGYDEVNIITKGANYGWPTIKGDQTKDGLVSPIIQSGSADTWAPSGMAYLDNSLFFSGLRGESLYEGKISGSNKIELIPHLKSQFGRIRAVVVGPDGFLYISTSNTDGRGKPQAGDDKIIKVNPKMFR